MPEFIPITASVHFKCAFDVASAKGLKMMTHLRQKFRAWCINRVGVNDQLLHRGWFYVGNNPKVEPAQYIINDYQLRTVSAPSTDPDEPTCWAFEVVHPDSDERARRWSAEITLRKSDDGSVRFTTVVKNWMLPNYIGEYPSPPTASAPSYVRSLLDDPKLTCSKGDVALRSQPVVVTNKTCRGVYDQLVSPGRGTRRPTETFRPSTGRPARRMRASSSLSSNSCGSTPLNSLPASEPAGPLYPVNARRRQLLAGWGQADQVARHSNSLQNSILRGSMRA